MGALQNYELGKLLHSGAEVELYSAVRITDRVDVILKRYRGDRLDAADSRARREFELLRALALPGICRAIEVVPDAADSVLVLESRPGVSLRGWSWPRVHPSRV
jgi:hypothetical protein